MPSWSSTEEGISAYLMLFMALLAIVLVLSKLLHDRPIMSSLLPEAGMILLVGGFDGFIINLFVDVNDDRDDQDNDSVAQGLLSFSPDVFFVFLLPPIIFNSGYHLRRELFFRHITPILLLAVVGTTISALTVAGILQIVTILGYAGNFVPTFTELLTFGALISSTDPVATLAVFQAKRTDPQLFYLVFGESVLNDAIGLVLFKSCAKFVEHDDGAGKVVIGVSEFIFRFLLDCIGSPVLGLLCGCGAAYLFKVIEMRQSKLLELSVYILIMYCPFLLAELLELSGIVTILFTGLTARTYVVPNLSAATADHAEVFFRLAAHLAETSIFLELGMSIFGLMMDNFQGLFILWALLACLIARAVNVYPIVYCFNNRLREKPHDEAEQLEQRHPKSTNASHVEMSETLRNADHQHANTSPTFESTCDATVETATPRYRRDLKIGTNTTHMLWFSGLRGAVA
jgi:NhaP-type Na+/H+ or K+/H+ antiporter